MKNKNGIEYRMGGAGGGNQLRQPYLKYFVKKIFKKFKNTEHIHFYEGTKFLNKNYYIFINPNENFIKYIGSILVN